MEPLSPESLQALIDRAAGGDEAARSEIVERFYARVRQTVHRELQFDFRQKHKWMLPLFSTQDVVQDVFASVLNDLEGCTFDAEEAFVRYLGTVVRHRLVDAVRYHESQKRDQRKRAELPTQGLDMQPDFVDATPTLAASLAERAQVLRRVLEGFPTRQRTLIELRLMEGETFAAIATRLGYASAETARQSFIEAQAKLLVRLRAKGIKPAGETLY